MIWGGADPGGKDAFGVARILNDGTFESKTVSSVNEAFSYLRGIKSVGIDCPLWWSTTVGGGRKVDSLLRKYYGISSGTVQSVNSLRGAVVVQGILLALLLRQADSACRITETHPKALLQAMKVNLDWQSIQSKFQLVGSEPRNEHERDAVIGAVVAKYGTGKVWTNDLALNKNKDEIGLEMWLLGEINYWWPETLY